MDNIYKTVMATRHVALLVGRKRVVDKNREKGHAGQGPCRVNSPELTGITDRLGNSATMACFRNPQLEHKESHSPWFW